MKKIKIISGSYGYVNPASNRVEPKDFTSEPFEVTDEEAARLVEIGVADYADAASTKKLTGARQEKKTRSTCLMHPIEKYPSLDITKFATAKAGENILNRINREEISSFEIVTKDAITVEIECANVNDKLESEKLETTKDAQTDLYVCQYNAGVKQTPSGTYPNEIKSITFSDSTDFRIEYR